MSSVMRNGYAVALVLGLLYLALLPLQPYPLSWALKPVPMLLFGLLLWRAYPGAAGRWLALGYLGAAAGDFFLDYGQRDGLFIQALLAFLVNQIAFAVAFLLLGRGQPWLRWNALPALLYGALLAVWMVPAAVGLQLPVAVYLASLLVMVLLACRLQARPGALWWGAMLFMLADSLIGLNKFVYPFAHSTEIIVSCYFSGQALITWGLLKRAAMPLAVAQPVDAQAAAG